MALGGRLPFPQPARAFSRRRDTFAVEVGLIYDLMQLRLAGTVQETVDRAAGRYAVRIQGQGEGVSNYTESRGILRSDRWAPVRSATWIDVRGRRSWTQITYDHDRGAVGYRARGETFLLRRLRIVDAELTVPPDLHVDDAVSAALNYADGAWPPDADGTLRTQIVRRQRHADEGPDDVAARYRAELVPLELRVSLDPATGREAGSFDLTPFSSWAREAAPARVIFGPNRRPVTITSSMILGTSVSIRFGGA